MTSYTQRPLRRLHSRKLCKSAARSTLGVLARKRVYGYGLMRTVNPSQVRSGSCKTKNQTLLTVSMCSCEQEKLAQLISAQLTVCRKQKKRAQGLHSEEFFPPLASEKVVGLSPPPPLLKVGGLKPPQPPPVPPPLRAAAPPRICLGSNFFEFAINPCYLCI